MNSIFSYKHQIIILLTEISKKLDKIVAGSDLSKEDALVKSTAKQVEDALEHLPHPQPQTKGT